MPLEVVAMINGVHGFSSGPRACASRARVTDEGFGLMTAIELPGGGELGLYEPRHPTALRPTG